MAINHWPEEQRPRERLINHGAQTLSDPELLAIFLRTGVKGKNAIELGRDLIQHFGSLRHMFSASVSRFSDIHGLGPAKYAQLQAVLELSRRALAENLRQGIQLSQPSAVKQYLQIELGHQEAEVFFVLFLDVQHRLIYKDILFAGSLRQAGVYPREVVKAALTHNAAAIIVAHNHPSGHCQPSQSDIHITNALHAALEMVDIKLLDHIIIAGNDAYSFSEHGQL